MAENLASSQLRSPPGRLRRRTCGAILLLYGIWGCDSAGPEAARGFTWNDVPDRPMGQEPVWAFGEAPDLPLHEVRDVRPLSDSLLAVLHGFTEEILLVTPRKQVRRIGGEGDGPGEFRRIGQIFPEGPQQVGVYDAYRGTYIVLSYGGDVVSSLQLVPTPRPSGAVFVFPVQDGSFLLTYLRRETGPQFSLARPRGPLVWAKGDSRDTLTWFPGSMHTLFFGYGSVVVESENGVWVGDRAERRVSRWTSSSSPAATAQWTDTLRRELTRERAEAFLRYVEQELPQVGRLSLENIPYPAELPAFHGLVPAENGGVLVGEYLGLETEAALSEETRPARSWIYLDSLAIPQYQIRTPEGFKPTWFDPPTLIGLYVDPNGVHSVRKYAIQSDPADAD